MYSACAYIYIHINKRCLGRIGYYIYRYNEIDVIDICDGSTMASAAADASDSPSSCYPIICRDYYYKRKTELIDTVYTI